jgi:predicted nucleotidyltransferase
MTDKIYTVDQLRTMLTPIFLHNDIRKAVLFGSYASAVAKEYSDIDILVDSSLRGLDFVGLIEEISETVDKNIDLFDISHIEHGSRIEQEIAATGVTIYEK